MPKPLYRVQNLSEHSETTINALPYIAADGLNSMIVTIICSCVWHTCNCFLIILRFAILNAKVCKYTETVINVMPKVAADGLNRMIWGIMFCFVFRTYSSFQTKFGLTTLNKLPKESPNVTYTMLWELWCSLNILYTLFWILQPSRDLAYASFDKGEGEGKRSERREGNHRFYIK